MTNLLTRLTKASSRASVVLLTGLVLLQACQSPAPKADAKSQDTPSTADTSAPSDSPGGFLPSCLNITEGDQQIEFDKVELLLTNNGKEVSVPLDEGAPVRCEKLRLIENARVRSVEVVFMTRPTGTSIQIAERRLGVLATGSGKWIVPTTEIEQLMQDEDGPSTAVKSSVVWKTENDKPVLVITNLETKKSTTYRP